MRRRAACVLAALFVGAMASPAAAQTVVQPVSGIGTTLTDVFGDGSGVGVASSVTSITYAPPVRVRDGSLHYFEVTGSIQGTGWGGEWQEFGGPTPIFDTTSHYAYDIPFVLRWHPAFDGTLVYYSHGRAALSLLMLAEGLIGPANEGRRNEREGDFVSAAVLTGDRRHAYFAPNLGGLKGDGSFSMIALDGPFAGQPLAGTVDAVTARDLARAAKWLLAQLTGRPVRTTIGTGHSAGALIAQFLNGGQSMILDAARFGMRLLTGGNYNEPYAPASGKIFDGFVAFAPSEVTVNSDFPLSAPLLMIGGQAEFAGISGAMYARRVFRAGGDASQLRLYQVRNLPHNWAEIGESTPNLNQLFADVLGVVPHADGDRMKPVVAAVIDRAVDWVTRGTPAPPSRIEGAAIDLDANGTPDAIALPYSNGGFTTAVPAVDDSSLDAYLGFTADTAFDPVTGRYLEVLGALSHVPSALSLPGVACRLGGFVISEILSDSQLVPFADMSAHWKNFGSYQSCIVHHVKALAATGLYDASFAPETSAAKTLIK
jgi:Alpha/beta hydrolase domain